MNHLTEHQIIAYADRTTDPAERTMLEEHCAACARCASAVRFHTALRAQARTTGLRRTSRGFTASVMEEIAPTRSRSVLRWILHNSSNILGMSIVLVVLFFALSAGNNETGTTKDTTGLTDAIRQINSFVHSGIQFLSTKSGAVTQTARKPIAEETAMVTVSIIAVLFFLGVFDKFIGKRVMRMQRR